MLHQEGPTIFLRRGAHRGVGRGRGRTLTTPFAKKGAEKKTRNELHSKRTVFKLRGGGAQKNRLISPKGT